MTPEAQRIAIAEACGYRWCPPDELYYYGGSPFGCEKDLPDYLNDLNAMHEAEKELPDLASDNSERDQLGYMETLAEVIGAGWLANNSADMWIITHATAAQRAEAFLRTISKWDDAK